MKDKKKKQYLVLPLVAFFVVASMFGKKAYEKHFSDRNALLIKNIVALTQDEGPDLDWFSALRPEECVLKKNNAGAAFYYNGVLIPAGGTYEVMGTRMECKFNLFNTCDVSKQTVCVEN